MEGEVFGKVGAPEPVRWRWRAGEKSPLLHRSSASALIMMLTLLCFCSPGFRLLADFQGR